MQRVWLSSGKGGVRIMEGMSDYPFLMVLLYLKGHEEGRNSSAVL